jgi:hypothetical protein
MLAEAIASAAGLPLLDQVPESDSEEWAGGGFLLGTPPSDLATAEALDAALVALAAPLSLVILLDLPQDGRATEPTDALPGHLAVIEHYRAQGLLRHLRGEADLVDQVNATLRIGRDLERAGSPQDEDPFAMALAAIAAATPTMPVSPQQTPAQSASPAAVADTASHSSSVTAPGWKAAAAKKGRFGRRHLARRPGGGNRTPRP